MRKKILTFVLFSCLASSSMSAAPGRFNFCPYHWYLGLVAVGESVVAYFPEYKGKVRFVEITAGTSVGVYTIMRIVSALAPSTKEPDEKERQIADKD